MQFLPIIAMLDACCNFSLFQVQSFEIDQYSVTNEQFRRFIRDTKYRTEAETFKWSFVLDPFVSEKVKTTVTESVDVRASVRILR